MKNKTLSLILAMTFMFINLFITTADADTVTISSKEDFFEFSKNCTLNTYSQGKTVNLTCNIDFDGEDYSPVPVFGGVFNGNGYTVSGISFQKGGSHQGMFRYIQAGGRVSNLTVKGNIIPVGSKSFVGGIAGENNGIIESCRFEGAVAGSDVVGGIAGINTNGGQIISCSTKGSVEGENSTGGITGKNEGQVLNCTNDAKVNTVYEEKKRDISDLNTDAGAIVETYMSEKEENEEDSILGHTDTGGIAGYSSGVIQGCTNNSNIGYPHIGYNTGGIAGRQSGYLLGCANNGLIQGRKDVGGIVGQMEPYILLDVSEATLNDIRSELGKLHSMTEHFIADTDSMNSELESYLNNISEQSVSARNNTQSLINQGIDFTDDNLNEISTITATVSNSLNKLGNSFDLLAKGASDTEDALDKTKNALESVELADSDTRDDIDKINDALDELKYSEGSFNSAASSASRAADRFEDGLRVKNPKKMNDALKDLSKSLSDMIAAKKAINDSVEDIKSIIQSSPQSFEDIGVNTQAVLDSLAAIKESTSSGISSMQSVSDSLDTIILNSDLDVNDIQTALRNVESAFANLTNATRSVSEGLNGLRSAADNAANDTLDYADDVKSQLKDAKAELSDAISSLYYAADDIKAATENIQENVSELTAEDGLTYKVPNSDFKSANDSLFNSLASISNEIGKLRNAASSERKKVTNDVNAISNQFDTLMTLLVDKAEETQTIDDVPDLFLDVSDEDILNTKQGKVSGCRNYGKIEADRNTGGITGSLSIEYAKDPENEIEKPDTLNFTYRTKAILQSCTNDGAVIGKKDCAGGVVGLSELGTVYECENYGNVESTGGNYVGGISGKSDTGIKRCYSKCICTGKRYVGGIAGKSNNLSFSYSIATVNAEEEQGALLGTCDNPGRISGCYYLDKGLGGIDGISYSGAAEPVNYETLCGISAVPRRMISFNIRFFADDVLVDTQELQYGEETARIRYPDPPQKEGHFGVWQKPGAKTVTEDIDIYCEYMPYITILASEEKNENGKLSLALAEGEFTDMAALHVTESGKEPCKTALGNVKVYDIKLSGTSLKEGDTVTLHLLNEKKENVTVWRLNGDTWEETDTTKRGKYVIVHVNGTDNTLCIQYSKIEHKYLFIILAAALIAAIAAAFIIIKKKRHSK
ncbi:MAG: hypothetical protein J5590_07815 [Clostridia bacterium]|nr:hypothetical protein [Clostridia bacterium]